VLFAQPPKHGDILTNRQNWKLIAETEKATLLFPVGSNHLCVDFPSTIGGRQSAVNKRVMAEQKYNLSFTAGGLMPGESTALAAVFLQKTDWAAAKTTVLENNLFQTRTESTALRKIHELIPRLSTLTQEQLQLIVSGSISEQRALLWLSVCKRNKILKDFAHMVVREKYLNLDLLIRTTDFDRFLDSQAVWHEELDQLTAKTRAKLATVALRMLREAELISSDGIIQPTLMSQELAQVIRNDDRSWFEIYPVGPADIPGVAA